MFEAIMTENFPQLMSDIKVQIQEAQRTLSRINPLPTIIFKLQKIKDKVQNLERSLRKKITLHIEEQR